VDTINVSRRIEVERQVVISARPFDHVVARLEAAIGRPDMRAFARGVATAKTVADVARVVHDSIGASGLMEMARFDLAQMLRKETGTDSPKILRLVVGNPLMMKEMVEQVRDAASYAAVTILVDERADGVYLSYDTMSSIIAPYGNADAMRVAQELDAKVAALLTAAAV
jgi:uncharacterized protein (DUF302 family)